MFQVHEEGHGPVPMTRAPSLTSHEAWLGTWVRARSGPTPKGVTTYVDTWHCIGAFQTVADGDERVQPLCYRLRYGLLWPSMGGRWEIARPYPFHPESLPGNVCSKCVRMSQTTDKPLLEREESVVDYDEVPFDAIVDAVLDRMRERAEVLMDDQPRVRVKPAMLCTYRAAPVMRSAVTCNKPRRDPVHPRIDERMRSGQHVFRHET